MARMSCLLRSARRGVLTLELNTPENRNALSTKLLTQLRGSLEDLGDNRAVVIRAVGPAFSSGHDLRQLHDSSERELRDIYGLCSEVMMRISSLPVPVIAAVHGVATAAGCQLVASCDIAVATSDARFATPGVNIGLFCSTPAVALARSVGRKAALEMLYTGRLVGAEEAQRIGLVSRVLQTTDPAQLHDEVTDLAESVAARSADALSIGKRTFQAQVEERNLEAAYAVASDGMVLNSMTADAREGISAFLSKRVPVWEHER